MGIYGPFWKDGGGPQFDWVQDFSEGLAAVGVGGKRDAQGNVTTMDGGKWGFIDQKGNTVIRPQFDDVKPFSSGVAVIWSVKLERLGLIDRTGNLILPYEFTSIEPFHEGLAAVRGPQGPGYITPDGRFAIRGAGWDFGTLFQDFGVFTEGLAPVNRGDYKAGFIDKTGRIQIPMRFNRTLGFSEGLAAVLVGDRWGYINTTGAMIIQPRFLNATSFVDGLALVDTGTFWSYIDTHGSVVLDDVFRSE
ncbi:MAG: WG repeat-containing protein [Bryobacteraceae bacterium]